MLYNIFAVFAKDNKERAGGRVPPLQHNPPGLRLLSLSPIAGIETPVSSLIKVGTEGENGQNAI